MFYWITQLKEFFGDFGHFMDYDPIAENRKWSWTRCRYPYSMEGGRKLYANRTVEGIRLPFKSNILVEDTA